MPTFNKNHYNSGDGMLTSVWGPPMWHTLHTISFNYPVNPTKDDIENYYNYFDSLRHILPCRYCRENYIDNLKKLKFSRKLFKNRECLSKFVYVLHEMVNKNLGKESGLTYNQVRDRYEHFRSRCLNKDETNPKIAKQSNNKKVIEKGCTDPLYGVKSKCVLNIVPKSSKKESLSIDKKCKIITKKKNKPKNYF
tara:strand:+ start:854 stop:1435 length:582 start_codon:yes stop_codon:yes gene_type:complete